MNTVQIEKMKKAELVAFANENKNLFSDEELVIINKRVTKVGEIRGMVLSSLENEIVVEENNEPVISEEQRKMNLLDSILFDVSDESYSMHVGEYEVSIPRKPTGDTIKDLKVGYMLIASSPELIEDDAEFKTDLEIEAYSLVLFVKKYRGAQSRNIERWYETFEEASDASYESYVSGLYDGEEEYDEDEGVTA